MPGKKFKEVNSKSVAAKERKAAVKRDEEERKRRQEEDEYWRDDDKHIGRKQDRKAEKERRRQEQIDKKVETRKLLEIEESSLKGKTSHEPKVTRAQIASHVSSSGATPLSKGATPLTTEDDDSLPENPNLLMRERELEGHHDADTIDDAIRILRGDDTAIERHPERRMKAAYSAFEERELPRLKSENPTLRLSQVKQLLRKEWMKSPENPMNQSHTTYRDKT